MSNQKEKKMSRRYEKVSLSEMIKHNLLEKDVHLPTRKTKFSAGYDFVNPLEDFILLPNESKVIPTGIKVLMPPDNMLLIIPRSGLGFKYFMRLANTIGIIDADYYNNPDNEGCIFIKLRNESVNIVGINKGDRIAQGIFVPYLVVDDDKAEGEREGGLGSTGN
jgi:dUTP pyrophosphatase